LHWGGAAVGWPGATSTSSETYPAWHCGVPSPSQPVCHWQHAVRASVAVRAKLSALPCPCSRPRRVVEAVAWLNGRNVSLKCPGRSPQHACQALNTMRHGGLGHRRFLSYSYASNARPDNATAPRPTQAVPFPQVPQAPQPPVGPGRPTYNRERQLSPPCLWCNRFDPLAAAGAPNGPGHVGHPASPHVVLAVTPTARPHEDPLSS
jgi:hypothetical protein